MRRVTYDLNKEIVAPAWAKGCTHCKYGLMSAPDIPPVASNFYMIRLVQAIDGDLTFCTCQAGASQRTYLGSVLRKLRADAKAQPMMRKFAEANSHPDIENIRNAMAEIAPSVHRG